MTSAQTALQEIQAKIEDVTGHLGFESYCFKVRWYNEQVQPVFKLNYPPDTIAFIFISTPAMFDKAFKPFITRTECLGVRDPIDECMSHYFGLLKDDFSDHDLEILFDYDLDHCRRPRILVQTAGHAAGACPYYQRTDVKKDPWGDKKIFGVSIHPKYGGWFAFRGVIIFKDIQVKDLKQIPPPDVLSTEEARVEALSRFNGNWKDWTFRDVIPVEEKYSEEQKEYFATLPKDRKCLIEKFRTQMKES